MRTLASLLALVTMLASRSQKVDLLIRNGTGAPVFIDAGQGRMKVLPGQEQTLAPNDRHTAQVTTSKCVRTFNLDEHYNPANEWQLSTFKIARRYLVHGEGQLGIVMPDQAHSANKAGERGRQSAQVELTPLTQQGLDEAH